ncbi:hypothetical protein EKE94_01400 [Mesobaculum littorinae]|uniref:Uncharacterized protein n=1 Tax=Mesobaculum littorinae TaxID=2486419 RepID=A0A438ALB9_9RHOB|nr:hypothetical protein [Mesobaculum littorinae]RVV99377.1 hypothetical protein EKE94_01400 [Mesobaculum littorinae]
MKDHPELPDIWKGLRPVAAPPSPRTEGARFRARAARRARRLRRARMLRMLACLTGRPRRRGHKAPR